MYVVNLRDHLAKEQTLVGGKAASLAKILALGVPSPEGFCVTAKAYTEHINKIRNQSTSTELWTSSDLDTLLKSDELVKLRDAIVTTEVSIELREAVSRAIRKLEVHANLRPFRTVVRSSATTEDLSEASFAGQHETYLNVIGEDAIIESIKKCWASLWTERAVFYRRQHGFDHSSAQMAVVIEELVPAEVSGTMFTANPVTKNMNEIVIEACWGLGELIVSGRITPDTYYVSTNSSIPIITRKQIKTKRRMLVPNLTAQGGIQDIEVPKTKARQQVLSDQTILDLAHWGTVLVSHYGYPLDIEWAEYNNRILILQSRPITSLE